MTRTSPTPIPTSPPPPAPTSAPVPSTTAAADPPELVAYAERQRLQGLAPSTIAMRERVLRQFAAWFGRPLREAKPSELRAFVAERRPHLSNASQVTEINYLQAFYGALVELGLVEQSPARGLRSWRPLTSRKPIGLLGVRALLLEASRSRGAEPVHEALAERNRAVLELLFATGMRASEVCAARVVDLDLVDGSILVRRVKRGPGRRLPLPAPAVAALRAYLSRAGATLCGERADPGALFLTREGAALERGTLYVMVKAVARRAAVKAHPHLFRRTLATELARTGVSLPAIQKVLGHAHLSTTGDYVEVSVDEMRQALEQLDRQLPRSHPGENPGAVQCRLFAGWGTSAA